MLHPSLFSLLSLLCSGGDAPQWGGFRGNNGCGVATTQGLPAALDPDGNLIWRVDVPEGYSSPTIAGKNLFVTGCDPTAKKLSTLCLDAYSGETRWRAENDYDGSHPGANSSAAPSPVTDGERVYALFHHLGLFAYDLSGKELWKKPIGPFNIPHGMSTSPVLYGDLVLLQVDQDAGAYLVAYDKLSGKERWRVERPGVTHSYATPAVYEPAGGPAELVVSGSFQIAAYSLATGEKRWWVDGAAWMSKSIPVFAAGRCFVSSFEFALSEMQMPSFHGTFAEALASSDADKDGMISKAESPEQGLLQLWFIFDQDGDEKLDAKEWDFALASNRETGGLYSIELGGKGDVTGSHVKWKVTDRRVLSDVTTPVIVDGTMFVIGEGSLLTSLDIATGKVIKQERVGDSDNYFASPVGGDGKLYLASLGGQLAVVKAQPEWEVLATHHLSDEEVWSTPALAGKAVYVRAKSALYCFEDA